MTPPAPIHLAVTGAAGRMGKRIIALAQEQPARFKLVAAIDRPDSPFIAQDAGRLASGTDAHVPVSPSLPTVTPHVIIDFSTPTSTRALIAQAVSQKIPLLIGTTGLTAADQALIDQAAKSIPILQAANTSLGVNVLLGLVAQAARQLGPDYDIEIIEAHHNQKKDAPSGTALALADAICKATNRPLPSTLVHGREGPDAKRTPGTIGMHALRMGDVVGDHTVFYATTGERIEIRHTATSRDTFAHGALRAAAFLAGKPPARYTMTNVLGL